MSGAGSKDKSDTNSRCTTTGCSGPGLQTFGTGNALAGGNFNMSGESFVTSSRCQCWNASRYSRLAPYWLVFTPVSGQAVRELSLTRAKQRGMLGQDPVFLHPVFEQQPSMKLIVRAYPGFVPASELQDEPPSGHQ